MLTVAPDAFGATVAADGWLAPLPGPLDAVEDVVDEADRLDW